MKTFSCKLEVRPHNDGLSLLCFSQFETTFTRNLCGFTAHTAINDDIWKLSFYSVSYIKPMIKCTKFLVESGDSFWINQTIYYFLFYVDVTQEEFDITIQTKFVALFLFLLRKAVGIRKPSKLEPQSPNTYYFGE